MVVNKRPQKRMKRHITADLNDFFTFPSSSAEAIGPFRTVVRELLSNHALVPPPSSLFPHLMTWQIFFRVGDAADQLLPATADGPDSPVICHDIVEEDVARSRNVHCDQCRVVSELTHPSSMLCLAKQQRLAVWDYEIS